MRGKEGNAWKWVKNEEERGYGWKVRKNVVFRGNAWKMRENVEMRGKTCKSVKNDSTGCQTDAPAHFTYTSLQSLYT